MATVSLAAPPKTYSGPVPLISTLHEIEMILRRAYENDEGPISLAEIGRRMKAKSVRHSTMRICVDELKRLCLVAESPVKGVMWVLHTDRAFWSKKGFIPLR